MSRSAHEYDVVVCGAGLAGVAAALEAARAGLRTALLEKTILGGGLATTGLILVYLPLCDGHGTQVTFGLAEELLHLSLRYGPGDVPADWRAARPDRLTSRYHAVFSPAAFVLGLDEALTAAKVEVWYDTLACEPVIEGDRITGVEAETKAGRLTFRAPIVIDATGDADLAHRAGAPTATGRNLLAIWAGEASLRTAEEAVAKGSAEPLLSMVQHGGDLFAQGPVEGGDAWDGLSAPGVTEFVLAGRELLRKRYAARQAEGVDRRQCYPLFLPAMAQFRTTRRVIGREGLVSDQEGVAFASSIGLVADWRAVGKVWEIPYGTLLPKGVRGLLVAGRCIDAQEDAWQVTRVIPACALTGQVAGIAARLALSRGVSPEAIAPDEIQRELGAKGIPYHLSQVYG